MKFPDRNVDEVDTNGDLNGDIGRMSDTIRITGKLDKCEAAKQALMDLVPITVEIEVPFDLHRSIIGQKGRDVRELMNRHDVHIELSPPEEKLDIIRVTGSFKCVEDAKTAIAERVKELEADREDRELRSFVLQIEIDPEFHPKIIGRRGVVVNKIREDHGVQISFPPKEDPESKVIRIQGYESATYAARDEIQKIVGEFDQMVKVVLSIDSRIHSRIIGGRGRHVREIMEDFKVEIKFAREGDADMNLVTIMGSEEAVESCKDHLLNLEEEFLQDVSDAPPKQRNTFTQIFEDTMRGPTTPKAGFIVQGAPWERRGAPNTNSHEDFPDFGLGSSIKQDAPLASVWNPNR